jgi:hypothetical protein
VFSTHQIEGGAKKGGDAPYRPLIQEVSKENENILVDAAFITG